MENGNWSQLINTKDCGRNKNQNGKQQFAGKTKQISDTIRTSFWSKQEHPSTRSHRDRPKLDKIKYKNGHHKVGKIEDDQQKMDEKENMNTMNNEMSVRSRRNVKQRAISNEYKRTAKRRLWSFRYSVLKKGSVWKTNIDIITFFLKFSRIQAGRLQMLICEIYHTRCYY